MTNEKHGLARSAIAFAGLAASGLAMAADPSPNPPQPPLAATVSEAARTQIAPLLAMAEQPQPEMSVAEMRAMTKAFGDPIVAARKARYQVTTKAAVIVGVPVEMVLPPGVVVDPRGPLLINFHGGGFVVDSGSLAESIPIAALTGLPVAATLYRLAPEHPYPAAVDDALAVYRDALKTRPPGRIAIFGTSAGACLTLQLLARIKRERLPMPAAAGFFSGSADFARAGDSEGYLPTLLPGKRTPDVIAPYAGETDRRDPLLSPIFGDLSGLPPMLLMTSTRDLLLSQTILAHLALLKAGVKADLRVYEGMPHAFWALLDAPETDEALAAQAQFLKTHLK